MEDSVRRLIPRDQLHSLNEVMEMGPNILPEILVILLRFRLHHSAIIGDITQAFLQLVLDRKHQDFTRFF